MIFLYFIMSILLAESNKKFVHLKPVLNKMSWTNLLITPSLSEFQLMKYYNITLMHVDGLG